MRWMPPTIALGLAASLAAAGFAGEPEEVMLRSGHAGRVEVLETSADSVTVKGKKSGVDVTVKLKAGDLDPHSYYGIRSRHMESTVENHVKLAVFCAENGLFDWARYQMDAAEALDPEVEKKILDRPDLLEKIGRRVLDGARRKAESDPAAALDMTARIIARAPDTKAAKEAAELAVKLEAEVAARQEADAAKRKKDQETAAAAASAEEGERMTKVLGPLEQGREANRKLISRGAAENGPSGAVKAYEAAGQSGEALLKAIAGEKKKAEDCKPLLASLDTLEASVRSDVVDAWLGAGNTELGRDNFEAAEKCGRRALDAAPGNSRAADFLTSVEAASVMESDFDQRYRRNRGGGRR